MKIQVFHPDKPGVLNQSFASLSTGKSVPFDVLVFKSAGRGYIPVNIPGWEPWETFTDIFGFDVYISFSKK